MFRKYKIPKNKGQKNKRQKIGNFERQIRKFLRPYFKLWMLCKKLTNSTKIVWQIVIQFTQFGKKKLEKLCQKSTKSVRFNRKIKVPVRVGLIYKI